MQPFKGFAAFAQDLIASARTARSRPLLNIGKKTRRARPDKLPKSKKPDKSTLCDAFLKWHTYVQCDQVSGPRR
ncbi:hypothetical protein NXT3_CH01401 [Sinorhizobium fredii]|uniref:Uncharacterized protein n=1 Tax=Rhizobium fredii TaxID=380 RepID=A0A2L0H3C3_RHIFR|nr:hypothetical protein NXT3_CH01401 [Sinorhizobium fredii]